eukprot:gene13628-4529_t
MPNQICCIGQYDNKSWIADKHIKRGHVSDLKLQSFPKDSGMGAMWTRHVSIGREHFEVSKSSYICSNHFVNGKPTCDMPYPTMFPTSSDCAVKKSSKKEQGKKGKY